MIVDVENTGLLNVWEESFPDRETGEPIKFYRALVNCPGEPPAQLAVTKDDYPALVKKIGTQGTAQVRIDAQPGRRVRVALVSIG